VKSVATRKFASDELVMICSASFKRCYEDIGVGYIYNTITRKEQYLDHNATALLKLIERWPKAIRSVLSELDLDHSSNNGSSEIPSTMALLEALEADGYILIGDSEIELNAKDPKFHYGVRRKEPTPTKSVKGYLPLTSAAGGFIELFKDHPRIISFQMEVTSKCNEKCIHCFHPPDWFEFNDLDTGLGLKVLDELRDEGTLAICFSGGEAFLHKEFDKLLYRARDNDLVISINTNATFISDYYIEVLKKVQPEEVQVSLYSMTPTEHDKITKVRGSHKRTMDGISRLMKADIRISISCPVMQGNKHCYKDVMRWGEQQGVQVRTDFMLFACTDFDQTNLSNRLSIEDVAGLIQDTLRYSSTYRNEVGKQESIVGPLDLVQKPLCGAGINTLSMDADGNSYFCPVFRPSVLGNLRNVRLQDVWHQSKPLLELRKIAWGDFPECVNCEAFNYCSMCFARNANESDGDHLKVNENCCEISFLNKRLVEEYRKNTGTNDHSSDTVSFKVTFKPSSESPFQTQA